jgi:hypothetical protein
MKRISAKKIQILSAQNSETEEEVKEVEHEFGLLLTESWEKICRKPKMHAKAIQTAKKLRELNTLLRATRQTPQSVH